MKENLFSYDAMIITRTPFENEANGNLRMAFWTTSIAHNVFYVLIKKKERKYLNLFSYDARISTGTYFEKRLKVIWEWHFEQPVYFTVLFMFCFSGVLEEAEFYNIDPLVKIIKDRIQSRDSRLKPAVSLCYHKNIILFFLKNLYFLAIKHDDHCM